MKKTVMLKKNYEFRVVLSKGICYRGNLFDIFLKKNNININKLGIAVGKKSGNSVKRNRIKRLIKENYKNLEEEIIVGYNIIILWKKKSDFESFNFYSIQEELKNLLKKMRVYRG